MKGTKSIKSFDFQRHIIKPTNMQLRSTLDTRILNPKLPKTNLESTLRYTGTIQRYLIKKTKNRRGHPLQQTPTHHPTTMDTQSAPLRKSGGFRGRQSQTHLSGTRHKIP